MRALILNVNPKVSDVFANYPDEVREKMIYLKSVIIETAEEIDALDELEITLRWGEPSFITKIGSTLRIAWKEKTPDRYAMYFQCTSRLVDTFRLVFKETFQYEGKRAIVFQLHQEIPLIELKKCIKATLTYHQVKDQMTLGI